MPEVALTEGVRDSMIKFRCKNCGRKISVPQIHAGSKGKCPKCKNIVVVPKVGSASSFASQSNSGDLKAGSKKSAYDLTLLEVPQKDKIKNQPISQSGVSEKAIEQGQEFEEESTAEEAESAAQRKLPWIIDIFLYPISVPGLITLAIIILIPLLIDVVARLLGPFGFLILIPGFFINLVIGLYFFWYLAECIRDSAAGGIRAPETLGNAPGVGDMFWQMLRIVGCYIVFAGPPGLYYLNTHRTDTIFWSLLAYAVFFFPMGLLTVVMFDSLRGLNPIVLIGSIFSTCLPYFAMIVVFVSVFLLILEKMPDTQGSPVLAFIVQCVGIYMAIVVAHLLGWFYHRYEQELNWEV